MVWILRLKKKHKIMKWTYQIWSYCWDSLLCYKVLLCMKWMFVSNVVVLFTVGVREVEVWEGLSGCPLLCHDRESSPTEQRYDCRWHWWRKGQTWYCKIYVVHFCKWSHMRCYFILNIIWKKFRENYKASLWWALLASHKAY